MTVDTAGVWHAGAEGAGERRTSADVALFWIAMLMVGGLAAMVVVTASALPDVRRFVANAGVGIVVAGAAAVVGGLAGFLFGIPRTLQQEASGEQGAAEGSQGEPAGGAVRDGGRTAYRANTNLEQISDWLTKILVGVGLTQLGEIENGIAALASGIGPAFDGVGHPEVVAGSLVIYFLICGFIFTYLWARLFLVGQLAAADLASVVRSVGRQVTSELERQSQRDARALSAVQQHLNPAAGSPLPSIEELKAAIRGASAAAKTTIFYNAWDVRSKNWRDPKDRPVMARTVPIFEALIDSDPDALYHKNHGQLGFALKDKPDPDYAGAHRSLSRAIAIRGDWRESGWIVYEWNRALCAIRLEAQERRGEASPPEVREAILDDLRVASHSDDLVRWTTEEPAMMEWLRRNDLEWPLPRGQRA